MFGSGHGTFTVGDETAEVKQGDMLVVPSGVLHYAVGNIPGAVPYTSTYALTNATLPYLRDLAVKGIDRAIQEDPALASGVNVRAGQIVHTAVAQALGV